MRIRSNGFGPRRRFHDSSDRGLRVRCGFLPNGRRRRFWEFGMKKFILLFHESPEMYRGLSPEEIQGIIEKYTSWRDRLERDGRYIEGRKLNGDGRVVRKADGGI